MSVITHVFSQVFTNRIAATVIVNQAVLKCMILGLLPTGDTITQLIGDHFDPTDPAYEKLTNEIMEVINDFDQVAQLKQQKRA